MATKPRISVLGDSGGCASRFLATADGALPKSLDDPSLLRDEPNCFEGEVLTRFLEWFRRVDLDFPKVEVRYQNLTIGSYVLVGIRALPTIPNFIVNVTEAAKDSFWYEKKADDIR